MRKYRIRIFTEEYAVNVFIGSRDEILNAGVLYTKYAPKSLRRDFESKRGITYNCFPEKNPLILIDGDLPAHIATATLAHEASHALQYLMDYLGMDDRSDEFRGHGIAAIMRTVGKDIFKKKKP